MKMSSKYYTILQKSIALRYPEFAGALMDIASGCLSSEKRDKLIDIITSELCAFGLSTDGEPTTYGKYLDDLISELLKL